MIVMTATNQNYYVAEPTQIVKGEQILILLAQEFNDLEFFYPYYRLIESGYSVSVVGLETGVCSGKYQMKFPIEKSINDVKAENFDVIYIPGGKAPEYLRKDDRVLKLVKEFEKQKKPIVTICHGPLVLLDAGILAGKSVTGFPEICGELKKGGANVQDQSVVRDHNVVTSRWPGDLPNFMNAFLKILKDKL